MDFISWRVRSCICGSFPIFTLKKVYVQISWFYFYYVNKYCWEWHTWRVLGKLLSVNSQFPITCVIPALDYCVFYVYGLVLVKQWPENNILGSTSSSSSRAISKVNDRWCYCTVAAVDFYTCIFLAFFPWGIRAAPSKFSAMSTVKSISIMIFEALLITVLSTIS